MNGEKQLFSGNVVALAYKFLRIYILFESGCKTVLVNFMRFAGIKLFFLLNCYYFGIIIKFAIIPLGCKVQFRLCKKYYTFGEKPPISKQLRRKIFFVHYRTNIHVE